MAWIVRFEERQGKGKLQPTQVIGHVKVFQPDQSTPIIQIDTYGSEDRAVPGKQSQTFQIGREAGLQLLAILKKTYGV